MVQIINTDQQWNSLLAQVRANNVPLVVQFSASWCGPCKRIYPKFEALANENQSIVFAKVDVDGAQQAAKSARVEAMPTFHAYVDNQILDSVRGANEANLRSLVQRVQQCKPKAAPTPRAPVKTERKPVKARVSPVTFVNSDAEWTQFLANRSRDGKLFIVQFSAEWCGPCKRIFPKFESYANVSEQIVFAKIDVEQAPLAAEQAGIEAMPTFIAYNNNHLIGKVEGADARKLEALVRDTVQQLMPPQQNIAELVGNVILIDSDEEFNALLEIGAENNLPVIAQFSSEACAPCKKIYPHFGQLCMSNKTALFAKVDAIQAPEAFQKSSGTALPTFATFRRRTLTGAFMGANVEKLEEFVQSALQTPSLNYQRTSMFGDAQ